MKIKSKESLKDLAGKELPLTVGEAVANILISDSKGGKMKLYVLATKFYEGKEIEVDEVDMKIVIGAIESTQIYNALVVGQLLTILK